MSFFSCFSLEKVRKNPKKPIKRAEEDDDVDYYFYSQNANFKDKTPKVLRIKLFFSVKTFTWFNSCQK